jgi:hypothetical protein
MWLLLGCSMLGNSRERKEAKKVIEVPEDECKIFFRNSSWYCAVNVISTSAVDIEIIGSNDRLSHDSM